VIIGVDIYGQIRHMYTVQMKSKRAISQELGISRNTVRKYCQGDKVPWERNDYERETSIVTLEVEEFIKQCLEHDEEEGLRKQNHTARRIFRRLVEEMGFKGGESTIRLAVSKLREKACSAFIPLAFDLGEAAQIDWGEAYVYLQGERLKIQLFCMRLCNSCDIFVMAFYRQNTESFLEGHIKGFEHYGGIPRKLIFDNGKVAVKEGFGENAKTQERYKLLAAHYAFTPEYCNPGKGNEKGLVESLVGWVRRNILVPTPHVSDIDELNKMLRAACIEYRNHQIKGQKMTVGQMASLEANALLPLPQYIYDPGRRVIAKVNDFSVIRFERNTYSVPSKYTGKEVTVRAYGNRIEILFQNNLLVQYVRSYAQDGCFYKLEHYMDILEQKPRSVFNARPVRECVQKELLEWGIQFSGGAKDMVKLLRFGIDYGIERLIAAKNQMTKDSAALTIDVVRSYLNNSAKSSHSALLQDRVSVNAVDLSRYDNLLGVAR